MTNTPPKVDSNDVSKIDYTFTPTELSISYTPDSDSTYLRLNTNEGQLLEIKVPEALAPAAFSAAQIANGGPIAPSDKVTIITQFDSNANTYTSKRIYIGPI